MGLTDPLADMLTRIRNAGGARFDKVDIPASQMKISLARILKEEGSPVAASMPPKMRSPKSWEVLVLPLYPLPKAF